MRRARWGFLAAGLAASAFGAEGNLRASSFGLSNGVLRADYGASEPLVREAVIRFLNATNEPLTNWLDKNLSAPKTGGWSELAANPRYRLDPKRPQIALDWTAGPGFGRFAGASNREVYAVDTGVFVGKLVDVWLQDRTWSNLRPAVAAKLRLSLATAFPRLYQDARVAVEKGQVTLTARPRNEFAARLALFTNAQDLSNQLRAVPRLESGSYTLIHNPIAEAIEFEAESGGFFSASNGTIRLALAVETGDVIDFAGMPGYRQWLVSANYQLSNGWTKVELQSNGGIWKWVTNREAPAAPVHAEFQQIHPSEMRLRDQLPKTAATNLAARVREALYRRVFFGGWDEP